MTIIIGTHCSKHGPQPISNCIVHFRKNKNAYSCRPCQHERDRNRIRPYNIVRNQRLKTMYGLTSVQYDEMVLKQNFLCAICNQSNSNHKLCVDHCHKTGKVRGLLCHSCNRALGHFKDSKENLERAIKYLNRES